MKMETKLVMNEMMRLKVEMTRMLEVKLEMMEMQSEMEMNGLLEMKM